ncbi:hypothetical protein MF406_14145 [Georgenia sp. TF02-10]|uniref:hypothetical protein n=1 Tax=Georgenia sp. TF02-10 TaxID=2917725 RepID=UPI001FA7F7E4|nr:hypothetical protein [Georgenia sp. TF02-10]UNX54074.1 hypothetical protein MF406_14145 [Georgenia sp. TF02-10]
MSTEPGTTALAESLRSGKGQQGTYRGTVTGARDAFAVTVVVDGHARNARLRSTAKAVRDGDTVELVKTGGVWEVTANLSWHEPPAVTAEMGPKPSKATVPSGTLPSAPSDPVFAQPSGPNDRGNAGSVTLTAINDNRADIRALNNHVRHIHSNVKANNQAIRGLIDLVGQLRTEVTKLRGAASAANSAIDYAATAGDVVTPIKDALAAENIVR